MSTLRLANILFNVFLYFLVAPVIAALGCVIFKLPFTWKRALIIACIGAFTRFISRTFFPDVALVYIIAILSAFLHCFFAFQLRKWKLVVGGFILFALTFSTDLITQGLLALTVDLQAMAIVEPTSSIVSLRTEYFPMVALATLCAFLLLLGLVWLLCFSFRWLSQRNAWGRIRRFRPIILTVLLLALFIFALGDTEKQLTLLDPELSLRAVCEYSLLPAALIILAFYIAQDLRAMSLSRQNVTLKQQQQMYDILLADTRLFRHNIANMLFGFEGAVLTGDTASIQAYYAELAQKCAVINNENAVALSRIPNAPVSAFLLNKIATASSRSIPFYLNACENLRWKALRDSDMCEVLGVLIDNALDAAQGAKTPYVAVEIQNIRGAMEITIRNTYAADSDLSFLSSEAKSNKQGHEGLGLSSVKRLLSSNHRVIMNQIQRGRYIETSLLFE